MNQEPAEVGEEDGMDVAEQDRDPKYGVDDKTLAQLESAFTYHAPKDDQPQRYNLLRDAAHSLALLICQDVPPGRERALALTNLEQAVMWANAGIARGE